jgi:hypothetical protein
MDFQRTNHPRSQLRRAASLLSLSTLFIVIITPKAADYRSFAKTLPAG